MLDYPERIHARTEDGNDPSSDGSSEEGLLGFDPPMECMGNFGYLWDSEGRTEMSVDYVGPDQLNRQRHVPQEHPLDVEVDTGMSPRTYPVTHMFSHQFLTVVKMWTSRAIKPILFPGNQPDALRERS